MSLRVVQRTIKLWCDIGDVVTEPRWLSCGPKMSPTQIEFLLALLERSPDLYLDELVEELEVQHGITRTEAESKLHEHRGKVEVGLENTAIQQILKSYGHVFSARDLSDTLWKLNQEEVNASMGSLGKMSPQLHKVKIDGLQNIKPQQLPDESLYKWRKNKFLIAAHILDSDDRWTDLEKQKLVGTIFNQEELRAVLPRWLVDKKGKSTSLFGNFRQTVAGTVSANDPFQEVVHHAKAAVAPDQVSDVTFITRLPVMCDKEPLLVDAAVWIGQIVRDNLKWIVEKAANSQEEPITLFGYSTTGIIAEVTETIKNIKANAVSPTGQQQDDAET
ncbi:hypothetical protein JB92DRAFT_3124530 [Gautieria morchelliformis]|nr:hypothetical protein JB92DRAFT_3124530 [Gautieria morchelliformis]